MNIGPYRVSSTRGKDSSLHVLRIRRGIELVCELYPARLDPDMRGHYDPYRFVRQYPCSKSRRSFLAQLTENGVSADDVRMILAGE